jgi:hypothetical protein
LHSTGAMQRPPLPKTQTLKIQRTLVSWQQKLHPKLQQWEYKDWNSDETVTESYFFLKLTNWCVDAYGAKFSCLISVCPCVTTAKLLNEFVRNFILEIHTEHFMSVHNTVNSH